MLASESNSCIGLPDVLVNVAGYLACVEDIRSLACVCKASRHLSSLTFVMYLECEYDDRVASLDIFGREAGPQYYMYGGDCITGYKYVRGDTLVGSHFYTSMVASNYGVTVINGSVYDMHCPDGMHMNMDPEMFLSKETDEFREWWYAGREGVLVRRAPAPTKFDIEVPEGFTLDNLDSSPKWKPKCVDM